VISSNTVSNVKVLEASTKASFQNTDSGAAAQLGPNGLRALNFISSSSDNEDDDVVQKVLDMGGILEGNVMMMPGGQTMAIPDTVQSDTGMPQVLVRWGMLASFLVEQLPEDVVGMLEKILQDIKAAVMTTHNMLV